MGGSIPDASNAVYFPVTVNGLAVGGITPTFGLKQVCLTITHTYDSDLEAKLIAPDGTTITLFAGVGGGDDNFTNTCFNTDSGNIAITAGAAPFTGAFLPQGSMGNFNNGQDGNGIWTLYVKDNALADTGSVMDWSITFDTNAPAPYVLNSNLPLVVLNTNGQTIPTDTKIFAKMKVIDNGRGNRNQTNDVGNVYQGLVNISVRGATSAGYPQKPYSITTYKADSTTDTNVVILNMPAEHDWVLISNYNDKSFLRNSLIYKLFNDMGHYAVRTRHCEVMLNGDYMGIYVFMEKIKRDANRVNISKLKTTDTSGNSLTGGYIFEHNYLDQGWTSAYAPDSCNNRFYEYLYNYPSGALIHPKQASYIKKTIDTLESRLYSPYYLDSIRGYRPKVNMSSFAAYMLCNELAWNNDGFKKSMYFHKNKDSNDPTIHAGPIWDFDWSMKRMPWTPADYSGWMYKTPPCEGDVLFLPWWNIMMTDTIFQNTVQCHWQRHRQRTFSTVAINQYIDSMANLLNEAQQRHFAKWALLGTVSGTPEQLPYSSTFQEELDTLKSILQKRMEWIDTHLPGQCIIPVTQALQKTQTPGLNAYPNPTNDEFIIEIEKPTNLQIINSLGQVLIQLKVFNNQHISTATLPNGMYTLLAEGYKASSLVVRK